MKNLFLTGDIGIGKTTIIKNILGNIDMTIGGYMTEKIYKDNALKIFRALSLYDNISAFDIAQVDRTTFHKIVYLETFKTHLVLEIEKSMKFRDLVVLDELGFMEESVYEFKEKVFELLDSPTPVLGVIKKHDCNFLNDIRKRNDVIVIEVDKNNRNNIEEEITNILKSFSIIFKKKR